MMTRVGLAAVLVATWPSAALAGEEMSAAAAAGNLLVDGNCSACHAIAGDDASVNADAPPFRDVVTRYPPEHLGEALAEGILTGHPDMP